MLQMICSKVNFFSISGYFCCKTQSNEQNIYFVHVFELKRFELLKLNYKALLEYIVRLEYTSIHKTKYNIQIEISDLSVLL